MKMGVLWTDKTYLKSAAKLVAEQTANSPFKSDTMYPCTLRGCETTISQILGSKNFQNDPQAVWVYLNNVTL